MTTRCWTAPRWSSARTDQPRRAEGLGTPEGDARPEKAGSAPSAPSRPFPPPGACGQEESEAPSHRCRPGLPRPGRPEQLTTAVLCKMHERHHYCCCCRSSSTTAIAGRPPFFTLCPVVRGNAWCRWVTASDRHPTRRPSAGRGSCTRPGPSPQHSSPWPPSTAASVSPRAPRHRLRGPQGRLGSGCPDAHGIVAAVARYVYQGPPVPAFARNVNSGQGEGR